MNKKILVFSNSLLGLYSFRKEVFQAYRKLGYEVYISSPIDNDKKKVVWFEEVGCKIIDTPFNRQGTNPIEDFRLMLTYWKLIKKMAPNIVLSYTIKPNLYGGMACALCGVPQLANITGLGAAVEYPGILQKFTIILYKLCMRKADLVFFQNEANLQFCLKHKMIRGRTRLIPGSGVNLEYHLLKPYPIPDEPIRFLFISRIRKEKGIEEYLAAAENIRREYLNTEFHIIGKCEGDYEGRLRKLTNDGIVQYHGLQSDVRPFIERASCIIHPSYYPEGMSNVLLEACAAGRPVITTNRPGCGEIVENGKTGFIVKQQDKEDVIKTVRMFLNMSYEARLTMGLEARKKVEREFDRNIVVNAYIEETKSLLGD
ncbi:MAG: glycosyltransferase family 4 protein [Mediterranea massiliensis]|nr:glycosyltransferase family 4 protein [Mediterranea massiliensis]